MNAEKDNFRSVPLAGFALSIFLSGALGVFGVLAFWGFNLLSITRFLLLVAPISAAIWIITYFLYFRRTQISIGINRTTLAMNAMVALLLSLYLVPPQEPAFRYFLVVLMSAPALMIINQAFYRIILARSEILWEKTLLTITLILAGLNLSIIIFNGLSVRIYADDFANILKLERLGLWRSGILFYQTWSADFFSNFLVVGFSNKPWAPLMFLIFIQLTMLVCLGRIFNFSNSLQRLSALAISTFLPLVVYSVTPDMYKSLYWNSSAMTLLPLLVMIPIFIILFIHQHIHHLKISFVHAAAACLLSFAITTTHEAAAVGWCGLQAALILWSYFFKVRNQASKILVIASSLSAVAGAVVLLSSPGAAARISEQEYSFSSNIFEMAITTFRYFINYLKDISRPMYNHHGFVRPGWLMMAGIFGLGWLVDSRLQRDLRTALGILFIAVCMSMGAFFPGALVLGDTIPMRTQFIPSLYLVLGVFSFGLILPSPSNQIFRKFLFLLLFQIILVGAGTNLNQLSRTIEPMRQYARDWDARDELVRTTDELPRRLNVPWDEYEQNLGDFRKYYRTR